jgi:threonine dehydrogenase-like Zn-dependent dehydrogenase
MEYSRAHCADWVLDASTKPSVSERIRDRFPSGVDIVVESTGFQELLNDAFLCCRSRGRFVLEGWYPESISYDFHTPHTKELTVIHPCFIGEREVREAVLRLMEDGALDMDALISDVVPFDRAAALYSMLFSEESHQLNGVIFDWRSR